MDVVHRHKDGFERTYRVNAAEEIPAVIQALQAAFESGDSVTVNGGGPYSGPRAVQAAVDHLRAAFQRRVPDDKPTNADSTRDA